MSVVKTASILEGVQDCLAQSLGVPHSLVLPEARLVDDLGMASVDLIDIVFKIQQQFGVYVSIRDIREFLLGPVSPIDFFHNGMVTATGLARLQEILPSIDYVKNCQIQEGELLCLMNVDFVMRLVQSKLRELDR